MPSSSRPDQPKPKARWVLPAIAAGAAALMLTSCGVPSTAPNGGSDASTVRIVLPEEPPTLEPCMNPQSSTGRVVRGNITEGLTFRDPATSEVKPMLATEWHQDSPDTWVFTLREGVKFHDGSDFNAEAVAATIKRDLDPALACDVVPQYFGEISLTTSVVDEHTIEIKTSAVDPILPLRISFVGITPTSTDTKAKVREAVGTGPYQFAKWDAGTRLTLDRFDDYWGEKPDFAKVDYVWRSEASIRTAMVESGEADVATTLTPQDKDKAGAVVFQTNETAYLRMDPTQAPLDDIRVRQAVNYAIDRASLLDSVFGGVGEIASQLVPEGVVGHNADIKPYEFDIDKAKDLIAEAKADGVAVDTPITLIGRNGIYPNATEAMEVVQAELAEIGLNVKIEMLEVNAWLEYLLRPFPAGIGATILQAQHGNQAGDASFTMSNNYGSDGGQSTYGTDALDKLIRDAETASDADRQAAFAKALKYQDDEIVRDAVLFRVGGVIAVSPRISYTPDSATYDEMRVAEMRLKK